MISAGLRNSQMFEAERFTRKQALFQQICFTHYAVSCFRVCKQYVNSPPYNLAMQQHPELLGSPELVAQRVIISNERPTKPILALSKMN